MKKLISILLIAITSSTALAGTDFFNRGIDTIYIRKAPSKVIVLKLTPQPENCGGPNYLLTNDPTWDDYTKAMYSFVLSAYVSKMDDLQIEIDCTASPYRIERITKTRN